MRWTLAALLALAACEGNDNAGPRPIPPITFETIDAEPQAVPPPVVESVDAAPEADLPTTLDMVEVIACLRDWKTIVPAFDAGRCYPSERFVLLEAADE